MADCVHGQDLDWLSWDTACLDCRKASMARHTADLVRVFLSPADKWESVCRKCGMHTKSRNFHTEEGES